MGPLTFIPEDECCAGPLTKALLTFAELATWECPDCGTPWRLEGNEWKSEATVLIFSPKHF